MAKRNHDPLPSVDKPDLPQPAPVQEVTLPVRAVVEVPLADFPDSAYPPRHVQVQLTRELGVKLWRIREGLSRCGEMMPSGYPVDSYAKVIELLLHRVEVA